MLAALRTADVLIVGGGITGCSTAYYLARAGIRVTLLEKGAVAYEASGRNLGAVRQQMRHPLELPIVLEGVKRWRTLDDELGMPTEYHTVGNVMATYHEEEVEGFREEIERQRPLGLSVQLLTNQELKEVAPGLCDEIVAGMYSPEDGQANPQAATWAFAVAARRLGARILPGVKVRSIRVEGGKVLGAHTDRGEFASETVLIAAGVGTPELGRSIGLDIPVAPWRLQPFITAPAPRVTHTFFRASGPRIALGQTDGGHIVFALGPAENSGFDAAITVDRVRRATRELRRLMPPLRDVPVVRAWTGWFEVTPDDLPILGPVEGIGGLYVAAGFCGHGFSYGPALGVMLSDLILEGKTFMPVDGFRLSRFQDPGYRREEPKGKLARLWANTSAGAQ